MSDLVSTNNPHGRITNSDLKLASLVLQEVMFPFVSDTPEWRSPFSGSNNTPPFSWMFQEASTLNPVVYDLIYLRSLVNHQFKITMSFFYHPVPQNTMAVDTSRKFHLALDIFLSYTTYFPQQSPVMWHACHPPSEIVSSVISALCKQPFKLVMSPVKILPRSIVTGCLSAPKCRCTTCLRTRRTPLSRYSSFLVIGSVTDTTTQGFPVSGWTRLIWHGMLFLRPTF